MESIHSNAGIRRIPVPVKDRIGVLLSGENGKLLKFPGELVMPSPVYAGSSGQKA